MQKIRILYVLGGIMAQGGTEAFVMNYIRNFNREKLQIDIVQCGNGKGIYDEELKKIGSKIFYLPVKSKHPVEFSNELKNICTKGKYQIVHGMMDTMNVWCLKIAKKSGVPVCISHSHNTQVQSNNILKKSFNNLIKKKISKYSDYLLACSKAAGHWLYGENSNFLVIKNGIDYNKFKYDVEKREYYRKLYKIDDKLVIGHVGQFREQKNHMFLIEVFNEIHKIDKNSVLILIGTGPLLNEVKEKINELDLTSSVIIINGSNVVNELLNMFDCYLFPSLYEGLSIALIEAQTNGLRCFTSTSVSSESNVLNKVSFLDLNLSPVDWAVSILNEKSSFNNRVIERKDLNDSGYDIYYAAKKMENFYIESVMKLSNN